MKMRPEHYGILLKGFLELQPKIAGHRAYIISEGKGGDLDKRLRWDIYHAVCRQHETLVNDLYSYLHDKHIDTALKSVMRDLGESDV